MLLNSYRHKITVTLSGFIILESTYDLSMWYTFHYQFHYNWLINNLILTKRTAFCSIYSPPVKYFSNFLANFYPSVPDRSLANACLFSRSVTKIWREGLFRLRNVSTNSYWHARLTVFLYNLFSPLITS